MQSTGWLDTRSNPVKLSVRPIGAGERARIPRERGRYQLVGEVTAHLGDDG